MGVLMVGRVDSRCVVRGWGGCLCVFLCVCVVVCFCVVYMRAHIHVITCTHQYIPTYIRIEYSQPSSIHMFQLFTRVNAQASHRSLTCMNTHASHRSHTCMNTHASHHSHTCMNSHRVHCRMVMLMSSHFLLVRINHSMCGVAGRNVGGEGAHNDGVLL